MAAVGRMSRWGWNRSRLPRVKGQSVSPARGSRVKPSERHAHLKMIISCVFGRPPTVLTRPRKATLNKFWLWRHPEDAGTLNSGRRWTRGVWECSCDARL